MKLEYIANQNTVEQGRIAYNSAMYIAMKKQDGIQLLVCRPRQHLLGNERFMAIFAEQNKVTETFTTTQCLRYMAYEEDEQGPYWIMSTGKFTSLAQLMIDKPEKRLEETWLDNAIQTLIEAVEYVNKLQHYAIELTPNSILVTKDSSHTLVLMPPLTDFIAIKEDIWTKEDEQIAPELFNIEVPDNRTDIYGIGRIIQYLYPYSTLPYKYSAIVEKAVCERVDRRPTDASSLQQVIKTRTKRSNISRIVISVSAVLAFFALLLLYPWQEEKTYEFQDLIGADSTLFDDGVLTKSNSLDPLVNTDIQSASEAEKDRMLESYLNDSTYMSMDTAYSLSPEMKQYQREMMQIANEKFRTAFKIQARPILQKVYTKENFESQEKFLKESTEANKHLLNIQMSLAKQYKVDVNAANRIASEVYDEVVNALKTNMGM